MVVELGVGAGGGMIRDWLFPPDSRAPASGVVGARAPKSPDSTDSQGHRARIIKTRHFSSHSGLLCVCSAAKEVAGAA